MGFSPEQKTNILVALIGACATVAVAWVTISRDSKPDLTKPQTEASATENKQKQIATSLSKALVYRKYDQVNDNFSVAFKAVLPVSGIEQAADSAKKICGEFREQVGAQFITNPPGLSPGFNQVIVTNDCLAGSLLVIVVFNATTSEVEGLWLKPIKRKQPPSG